MKVIKRLERYLSAAFSLGRIKSMSKDAQREIAELRLELGTRVHLPVDYSTVMDRTNSLT